MLQIDYSAATWDLAYIIGMSVIGFITVIALVFMVVGIRLREGVPIASGGGVALICVVLMLLVSFPYDKQYHAYYPVTGTVQQVDKRLLPDGDSMQEKIVVLYEGSSQQFGCEDTRCASVRPGDELSLKCITDWDFQGADGRDCRFVSFDPKGPR
jgi:hypothetical protein